MCGIASSPPTDQRTPIWGYPYPSKWIQYSEGGITKTPSNIPRTWAEAHSRYVRHWVAITIRPGKLAAYKYLTLELLKTPNRALHLLFGKGKKKPRCIAAPGSGNLPLRFRFRT